MEYVIEIQHNTIKKVQANYFCLLCDVTIKEKKGATGSNLDLMLGHIKSTAHRMKYLVSSHKRAEKVREGIVNYYLVAIRQSHFLRLLLNHLKGFYKKRMSSFFQSWLGMTDLLLIHISYF